MLMENQDSKNVLSLRRYYVSWWHRDYDVPSPHSTTEIETNNGTESGSWITMTK